MRTLTVMPRGHLDVATGWQGHAPSARWATGCDGIGDPLFLDADLLREFVVQRREGGHLRQPGLQSEVHLDEDLLLALERPVEALEA